MRKTYEEAQMDIIFLAEEDVIITSGEDNEGPVDPQS